MSIKNKTIKFISAFLIILVLVPTVLFYAPKKADAVLGFGDIVFDIPTEITTAKDLIITILKQVIMMIEKRLLQQLTQSTVNWINRGFSGNPLYLQNSDSFFKDIAKFEVKNLVDLFGYDRLRYPFGQDFALNAINSYKRQLADNTQYSLSKVMADPVLLDRYRNDFNVGGWNGFLINTQYPQNNYVGFQMLADEELARRVRGTTQTATQKIQTTLQQGMGFLSPKLCPTNAKYNNLKNEFQQPSFDITKFDSNYRATNPRPDFGGDDSYQPTPAETQELNDWQNQYDEDEKLAQIEWGKTNACPGGLIATTPGSVVANQITTAMGSTFRQSELGAALGNSIGLILDTLVKHFFDKGLNGLANVINPAPPADTWNYFGNTLGGSGNPYNIPTETPTTPPGNPAPVVNFNTPTSTLNVSVSDITAANVILSGGTPPYNIVTQPDISMAIGYISDNTLVIAGTGTTAGQTSIEIQDSSSPPKTITINITVSAPGTNLANPPVNNGGDNGPGTGDGSAGQTCSDLPNIMSCSAPDHTVLVQQVKDYVVSSGISITGSCGAFEITKRVAWALRGEGAGLLTTTHSGQCNGIASGNLAYTDDSEVDILRDEGGDNTPSWQAGPGNPEVAVHYQAPTDPGDPAGSYPISPVSEGGNVGGTGPVSITGAGDTINLNSASIVSAPTDIANWPATASISSVTLNPGLSVDFTKKDGADRWPDQFGGPGVSNADTIQYTVWFFTKINGQWVGSAFIQSWFGRNPLTDQPITGSFAMRNLWYSSVWSPMFGHNASGEQVGIMVTSGNSRLGGVPQFKERSNIVLFRMP